MIQYNNGKFSVLIVNKNLNIPIINNNIIINRK